MAPHHNSSGRIEPTHFVGSFLCWGIDNKEVPVRAVAPAEGEAVSNLELKTCDHMGNQFYVLAAAIACGIDGINKNMKLPPPVAGDPAELSEEDKSRY